MQIAKFHYLTQDMHTISHQELAEIACVNGIKWIQLRVKNKAFEEHLVIAKDVKKICDQFNTTLIINDQVEICKAVNASGVHLGKNDMPVTKARKILGGNKIIGGTANTLQDILQLEKDAVDYIGLGPYKFTKTKNNLSAILGLDGYRFILNNFHNKIPIIAIGGIEIEDIEPLIDIGFHGIAVSSAINLSKEKEKTIAAFLKYF